VLPQAGLCDDRPASRGGGIETWLGNHSFRATGISACLKNGGTLERPSADLVLWNMTEERAVAVFGDYPFDMENQRAGNDVLISPTMILFGDMLFPTCKPPLVLPLGETPCTQKPTLLCSSFWVSR
jgi:hypothetical protein